MRVIISLILMCLALMTNAKHLEFMGVPINGSIATFQSKLQEKGCTLMKENNKLPSGVRGFNGVFAGKDCNIYVWYNHRTKQVYKVRAVTDCGYSIDNVHSTFYYFKNLLHQKYDNQALNSDMLEDSTNGEYEFDMAIIEPPIQEGAHLMGTIEVRVLDYDGYPTTYGISITYEDFDNSSKNEENTLNDL